MSILSYKSHVGFAPYTQHFQSTASTGSSIFIVGHLHLILLSLSFWVQFSKINMLNPMMSCTSIAISGEFMLFGVRVPWRRVSAWRISRNTINVNNDSSKDVLEAGYVLADNSVPHNSGIPQALARFKFDRSFRSINCRIWEIWYLW